MGFCNIHRRLQNENYYQSSMIHRVDTNASTHPMMSNFEVNPPINFEVNPPPINISLKCNQHPPPSK